MKIKKKLKSMAKNGYYRFSGMIEKARLKKESHGTHPPVATLIVEGDFSKADYPRWIQRKAKIQKLRCKTVKHSNRKIEVLLDGDPDGIRKLLKDAWKGPLKAQVQNVEERWSVKDSVEEPIMIPKKPTEADRKRFKESVAPILNTLKALESTLKEPNTYKDTKEMNDTLALKEEAKKRNLIQLEGIFKENYFIGPDKSIGFSHSESSKISTVKRSIAENKKITKEYLEAFGLPVPKGRVFSRYDEAKVFLGKSEKSLVIKPLEGFQGNGVSVNIRNEEDLTVAWKYAKNYHDQIVVEEFVKGVDVRVLIVGGKAFAAFIRVPANIIGDGGSTIAQLIKKKNLERMKNPRLAKKLIITDEAMKHFLGLQGYHMDSVLEKGEVVILHMKANLAAGGDSIEVTDQMHEDLLRLSEEVAKVLDETTFWGVDLMVEDIRQAREGQSCHILEVNSRAALRGIQYPMYGKSHNLTKAYLDHLFGEEEKETPFNEQAYDISLSGLWEESFEEYIMEQCNRERLKGYVMEAPDKLYLHLQGKKNVIFHVIDQIRREKNEGRYIEGVLLKEESPEEVGPCVSLRRTFGKGKTSAGGKVDISFDKAEFVSALSREPFKHPVITLQENGDLEEQLFRRAFKKAGYSSERISEELYKIENDHQVKYVAGRFSSLFSDRACEKRYTATRILELSGIPTLPGIRFKCQEEKKALEYYRSRNRIFRVTNLNPQEKSEGIIHSEEALKDFWEKAKAQGTNYMYMEPMIEGLRVLIPVVGSKALGSFAVFPTEVEGDGILNLRDLIEIKNRKREGNPFYRSLIIQDAFREGGCLNNSGYTPTTILSKGDRCMVEDPYGLEYLGETVDITLLTHEDLLKKAAEAVEAIPGLKMAVVEMILTDPRQAINRQEWAVSKIDTKPDIPRFHFPWSGSGIPFAEEIVGGLSLKEPAIKRKAKGGTV